MDDSQDREKPLLTEPEATCIGGGQLMCVRAYGREWPAPVVQAARERMRRDSLPAAAEPLAFELEATKGELRDLLPGIGLMLEAAEHWSAQCQTSAPLDPAELADDLQDLCADLATVEATVTELLGDEQE